MVFKCCVPGCKSGYTTDNDEASMHAFPKDENLKKKWIQAIPRDTTNWMPTDSSRVCGIHFRHCDFYSESQDSNPYRKRQGSDLKRRRLKNDSVPSQFPNLPSYLSKEKPEPRGLGATASNRFERQSKRHAQQVEEFLEADKLASLEDLKKKLDDLILPSGIDVLSKNSSVTFMVLTNQNEDMALPMDLLFYLHIREDLEYQMVVKSQIVPLSKVKHINKGCHLKTLSAVSNVMAFLKGLAEDQDAGNMLSILRDNLEHQVEQLQDQEQRKKIGFIVEQLTLALVPKSRRRYSSDLLVAALMWKTTSSALYRQLLAEDILTLPSMDYLSQLSRSLSTETGMSASSLAYLKARAKKLSDFERTVVLMFDEIYCAQRVEYAGGQFYGSQNDAVCKTLLCFMIKSIAGKYSDMVSMCPVRNLDSTRIKMEYDQVLQALTDIGFKVKVTSVDNAAPNRKFYTEELCQGHLKTRITHPLREDEHIYLLFDSVHNFKNVFNNFHTRKVFIYPALEPGKAEARASFQHIEELFRHEFGKSVKMAYKLSDKVLHPTSIEKTNVQLADSLFHDSTIAALRYYADEKPHWKQTADFLQVIRNWWNILNVKTPNHGLRKRNKFMKPITKEDKENLRVLQKFAGFLKEWRENAKRVKAKTCLTEETFTACLQTTLGVIDLTEDLLENNDLSYVMTGNFQSDPIERRFGWYRQLAGANYFVSTRQILEAEKSIRLRSLMKFTELTLDNVKEVFKDAEFEKDETVIQECAILLGMLDHIITDFNSAQLEDASILYYIAGCFANSLCKQAKCENCVDLLRKNDETPVIVFHEENGNVKEKEKFLEQVNRGGLIHPSDLAYMSCLHAWKYFKDICDNEEVKEFLLGSQHPRRLFVMSLMSVCKEKEESAQILTQKCQSGHEFSSCFQKMSVKMFNTFAKNLCSEKNSKIHQDKKRSSDSSDQRKVKKLQSC